MEGVRPGVLMGIGGVLLAGFVDYFGEGDYEFDLQHWPIYAILATAAAIIPYSDSERYRD